MRFLKTFAFPRPIIYIAKYRYTNGDIHNMLVAKIIATWILVSAIASLIIGFVLRRIGREDELSSMRHQHALARSNSKSSEPSERHEIQVSSPRIIVSAHKRIS
jgi:hypothetical protein